MRLPIEPAPGNSKTDLSVTVWQIAHEMPTLSGPAGAIWILPSPLLSTATTPATAFASTSFTVTIGSFSIGALAGDMSVFSSFPSASRIAGSIASISTCNPASSACFGVSFASAMPLGSRAASVQKPSLPKVSNRKTFFPAAASPRSCGLGFFVMPGPSDGL